MNKKAFIGFAVVTAALLSYGLHAAFSAPSIYVPAVNTAKEQEFSEIFRIFYYHVPSAWTAFLLFLCNFLASVLYLVSRKPSAEQFAKKLAIVAGVASVLVAALGFSVPTSAASVAIMSTAPSITAVAVMFLLFQRFFVSGGSRDAFALATAEVGVVFCTVVLVTGPIWARPVWGIWWTWDARLTSTLVLWLIYVSYLLLRRYASGGQTPALAAALAIFGFLDVPFVYMAIRWFRTQHPQPVIGGGENAGIAKPMLHALLVNFVAFLALAILLVWIRYAMERMRARIDEAHAMASIAGDAR
jgi:ABC-type transport system involved in cytochrome c biogenesis permease subunit